LKSWLLRSRWEIAIIVLGVTLAAATAAKTSPTADEEKHILNGLSFEINDRGLQEETPSARLHSLLVDVESLDLSPIDDYRSAVGRPVKDLWNDPDASGILLRARVCTVVAFLVLLIVCMLWANALFAPTTARVVLAVAATCPTLLAHASVATGDMFLTTCAFGTWFALYRYQQATSAARAGAIGLWAGLALLAKISGVFVYGTIILAFAWLMIRERKPGVRRRQVAGRLALVVVVPLIVLHAGYGCRGVLRPLNASKLESHLLHRIGETTLGSIPLPVPAGYVQAIDYSLADRRRRLELYRVPSYMLGDSYVGTRLSYFPFAFLVKTSGVVLVFLGLGLWAARKQRPPNTILVLGVFPLVFFLGNVFLNSFDIGVRYLLPIYPFVILWGGFGVRRVGTRIAVPAAVLSVVVALVTFPNYLASFNLSSWLVSKDQLLSDSNLDWGQMNHVVAADLEDHPTQTPVRICTLGPVIGLSNAPGHDCLAMASEARIYLSRTIAHFTIFDRFTSLLRAEPARTLSDVIDVYDLTEADFGVTFVNDWEVSSPFPAPADPENLDWRQRESTPLSRRSTRFGLVEIGQAGAGTCVVARSVDPLVGQILLGVAGTAYVFDDSGIIGRATVPSTTVTWPSTVVELAHPARLRLLLCNDGDGFAVQAARR